MSTDALRTTNESAFQRRARSEGGDAGRVELIIILRIQEPGTAGCSQNQPGLLPPAALYLVADKPSPL